MSARKFLGIFINPVLAQSEGIQPIFDNIESAGAEAICITPYLARPLEKGQGRRFPPLHIDGYQRVLARPVWGKQEINLESFLAFEPDLNLYAGIPYRPAATPVPPEIDREVINDMIAEAKKRGMKVHILVQPFVPSNVRVEDQPVSVDGSTLQPPQVVLNGCLNNPGLEAYGLALIEDIMQHYRHELDGLFTDWTEYNIYRFEGHFTCFCSHCERQARMQGFDWDMIKQDVLRLWRWFHTLTPTELERSRRLIGSPSGLLELLTHYPGWLYFLQFKARSVTRFYRKARQLLDGLGLNEVDLSARGWPPPWSRSSGMDYRALAEICGAVTPKLFTFDYSALPRWYGQTLLSWNPNLSESAVLDALVEWMHLPDNFEQRSLAKYHIPAPTESHPAQVEAYQTRLDEVVDQVGGKARCYPFAHAYLPEPQWQQMVTLIRESRVDGMWVQMYGYLSDRKLEILREIWR